MKRTNTVNAPRALDIKGQPHQLSYITAEEAEVLKALGGSGKPGPMGIPSYFGDDFADFEGGGADARGGGSNYDSSPTGQQGPSFSSDSDSGFDYGAQRRAQAAAARQAKEQAAKQAAALKQARDAEFARQVASGQTTIGFTGPRGGTTVFGNTIKGGKISGFSSRDLQNEKTLAQFGFGDSNSNAFKQFLSDTGASVKNPFGKKSPGLFGKIFEPKDLDFSRSVPLDQRKKTLEANFLNYVNPATKQRFGTILGSAEGEKSLYGDRVKGVRQQSLGEGIAGLAMGSLFPGLGMLETRERTRFAAPEMLPEGYEQPQGGLLEQFLGGFGGILQPTPDTTIRAIDRIGQAGSDLIQRGREAGSNLMSGIRSLIPDAEADQVVDTVRRPQLSQTVSGGRFEDESARTQQEAVPTAFQDFSTMPGSITNAYPELFAEPEVFTPNVTTITSGAPPYAEMTARTRDLGNDTGGPGTGPFSSVQPSSLGGRQLLDPNFEAQFGALKAANDEAIFNNRMFDRTRLR